MTAVSASLAPSAESAGALTFLGPERDAEWDALVGSSPCSGFMQTSFWAAFKRAEGYQTRRYGWFRGGELRGGATVYFFQSAEDQPGFAFCPEGPALPWDDTAECRLALRALIEAVREEWPEAIGLRIEPHLPPPRPALLRNWQRAPVDLTPVHTRVLDLTQPEEALLAAMHPKGRYNLRLSARHGVTVRHSESLADMRQFYDLFSGTARRQDFFAEPYGFFLNLGAALFPQRRASLLFAEHEGETLAAALNVYAGERATYLYGGSSLERRNVMACHALHGEAIREARRRGCREYDFYGIAPFDDPRHPYAGFTSFKRQFGGRTVESMGAQECLFYDRLATHLIRRLPAPKA